MGAFSRLSNWAEENLMYGLTPKTLKANPALIPMHFFITLGVALAVGFSARTMLYNPEATNPITKKPNYKLYQDGTYFKIINITGEKPPCLAPEYRMPGDPSDESYGTTVFK